jgi:cardiolipin synthase A/B
MAVSTPPDLHAPIAVGDDRLTLITEGPERLRALLDLIAGARDSLRLLFYMFAGDGSGRQVRDALIDAARRGVSVAVLTDRFGCSDVPPDFLRPMTDAGIATCQFHPSWGRRYLLRNHQKLAVADDQVAIIGGANVADAYFGIPPAKAWRDLWLVVEGPAAGRLASYFDAVMRWARGGRLRIRRLRRIIRRHSDTHGRLQWQFGGPMRRWSRWHAAVGRDLNHAGRMAIIAAYFSPPPGLVRRISRLGSRGEARVVTAAKSDNHATVAAARHTYRRLLRRGVRIFEYQPLKLHTKLMIVDDIVHIGSANFDFRSLYLNLELMLRVDDHAFAERMWRYFEAELDDCVEITPELYRSRATWWRRLRWTLSHFLVTTMDYTVTRRLNFGEE